MAVRVNVGRGVCVGEGVSVGKGVGVREAVGVRNGVRVAVEEGVGGTVEVSVADAVNVTVIVRVGVRDNAMISNCTCSVCAARVASALRFCVGVGRGVCVRVDVTVGGAVRVGVGVEVI